MIVSPFAQLTVSSVGQPLFGWAALSGRMSVIAETQRKARCNRGWQHDNGCSSLGWSERVLLFLFLLCEPGHKSGKTRLVLSTAGLPASPSRSRQRLTAYPSCSKHGLPAHPSNSKPQTIGLPLSFQVQTTDLSLSFQAWTTDLSPLF